MILRRRKKEQRRQRIIAELRALQQECRSPGSRSFVGDMILYAEVGKDRFDLPESWVPETRKQVEEWTTAWDKLTA